MICKLANVSEISPRKWYEFSLQTEKSLLSIMLIHQDDEYVGFKNSCPHQGRRMDYAAGSFLVTETGNIVCPAHGAEFNPTSGLCINGPCLGQSLESIKIYHDEKNLFAVVK